MRSRNSLDGKIVNIRRGLAIYKIQASPYYRVRIWLPSLRKRVVRTTKTSVRTEAIKAAEQLMDALGSRGALDAAPASRTFRRFAEMLIANERSRGERGEISARLWKVTKFYLEHKKWGALKRLGDRDIGTIQTKDYHQYLNWVQQQDETLAPATLNHIASNFAKVMKLAAREGAIDQIPATPRVRRKDNPRPFFRFSPLVDLKHDEYKLLLATAKEMAVEKVRVRETTVTDELYDFILFMTHTFVRPTESEVYAIRHADVAIASDPKRLLITIRKGKTGQRVSNSLEAAVSVYRRIVNRHPNFLRDDYIFLPKFKNRSHAKRIFQRQFNALLDRCNLKTDQYSDAEHTVYSLRHTAICMRLVLSEFKVNIFNLAKNAGTSVDQIERFYAKNLPQSREMAKNLHSFGTD